jgi:hypothetical protein
MSKFDDLAVILWLPQQLSGLDFGEGRPYARTQSESWLHLNFKNGYHFGDEGEEGLEYSAGET